MTLYVTVEKWTLILSCEMTTSDEMTLFVTVEKQTLITRGRGFGPEGKLLDAYFGRSLEPSSAAASLYGGSSSQMQSVYTTSKTVKMKSRLLPLLTCHVCSFFHISHGALAYYSLCACQKTHVLYSAQPGFSMEFLYCISSCLSFKGLTFVVFHPGVELFLLASQHEDVIVTSILERHVY